MNSNKKKIIAVFIVVFAIIGSVKTYKHRAEVKAMLFDKPVAQATAPPGITTPAPPLAKVEITREAELAAKIAELEIKLEDLKQEQAQKIAMLEKNFAGMVKIVEQMGDFQYAIADEMESRFAKLTRNQKESYAQLHREIGTIGQGIKSIDSTIASLNGELRRRENTVEVARKEPVRDYYYDDAHTEEPIKRSVEPVNAVISTHPRIAFEKWDGEGYRDSSGDYVKVTTTFSTWGATGKSLMVRAAVHDTDNKEWDVTPGLSINPTKEGQFYREFVVHIPYREIPKDSKIALKFYDKNDPTKPIAISDWKLSKDLQPFKRPLYGYR